MEIKERKLKGVFEISLDPLIDKRGFFMRTFDTNLLKDAGLQREWVQENHSRSTQKGIIRGLHFQLPPYSETKLIRCIAGEILDVFVDLRHNSVTFGQWDSVILSAKNKKMIFIPKGFAHGFCTRTQISEVLYKVDNFYSPEFESGLLWCDTDVNIDWQNQKPFLSEKDKHNLTFKDFTNKYNSIKI